VRAAATQAAGRLPVQEPVVKLYRSLGDVPGLVLVVKQGYQTGDQEDVQDTDGSQFPPQVAFLLIFLCHRYVYMLNSEYA